MPERREGGPEDTGFNEQTAAAELAHIESVLERGGEGPRESAVPGADIEAFVIKYYNALYEINERAKFEAAAKQRGEEGATYGRILTPSELSETLHRALNNQIIKDFFRRERSLQKEKAKLKNLDTEVNELTVAMHGTLVELLALKTRSVETTTQRTELITKLERRLRRFIKAIELIKERRP